MKNSLCITTTKQISALSELANNVSVLGKSMANGIVGERTSRALHDVELGLHDLFLDLPVLWMESINARLRGNSIGDPVNITATEAKVLVDLTVFLNQHGIFEGDFDTIMRILSELSHADIYGVEL